MKMLQGNLPVSVLCLFLISVLASTEDDQSGFISIDCGIVKGSNYTDEMTGMKYISDADFIDSGEIHSILPIYNSGLIFPQLTTLRSFPGNTRNCYTIKPTQGRGNRYLIRAKFMYGNYDFNDQLPEFDVHLGTDYWDTMKFNSTTHIISMEMIHVPSSDYIYVCLVDTGHGTPFISAIEIRLLGIDIYTETKYGPLYLFQRSYFSDFGSYMSETGFGPLYPSKDNWLSTIQAHRYNIDAYDRIWSTIMPSNCSFLENNQSVNTGLYSIPSEVMSNAIVPIHLTDPISISWYPVNATDKFFVYLHFAETEKLKSNQYREFNIYLNGNKWQGPYSPLILVVVTLTGPVAEAPTYTLTISRTKDSTLPPIINAFEIYSLKQTPPKQTDDRDAAAILRIKSAYKVTKDWQGDPCAPNDFSWDGVRCSYSGTEFPRITFLNLSASGLYGEINPQLANLTMIQTLDLSNNKLTGKVPTFLSGLNFLKVLNLKGNHFIGPIPTELLEKSNEGSLSLSYDGDGKSDKNAASSCDTNHCENKKSKNNNKIIILVLATVPLLFVILTTLTVIWVIKKQKARGVRNTGTELEIRKQQYTYSEVQSITENFNVVLGKGGFGTVYHGHIDDTQVAVKILSESSLQGDKEFQAEANLLLSIHHKNITALVGYCNEGSHKGIIYEYMANGNLESHIFDGSSSLLNWEERLQIGCDAAHGLEYLHHGCKPGIVHRDIKCTNILLNETFQAKLADFGLSKAFPAEGGSHITTAVAGTPGYLDPEYYTSYRLTKKSDVYSFGVVLLVLITGQPAVTKYDTENIHIIRWVSLMLTEGNVNNIVDPRLIGDFDINSAWKVVELAMACVHQIPNRRPTMNEVVTELNDCLATERARQETKPKKLTGLLSLNLESAHDPNPR